MSRSTGRCYCPECVGLGCQGVTHQVMAHHLAFSLERLPGLSGFGVVEAGVFRCWGLRRLNGPEAVVHKGVGHGRARPSQSIEAPEV